MGAGFTNPLWPRRVGIYEALMYDTVRGYDDFRKLIVSSGLDRLALAYQQRRIGESETKSIDYLRRSGYR